MLVDKRHCWLWDILPEARDNIAKMSVDTEYEVEDIDTDDDIIGFNVTIPYKEEIIPYLDTLSKTAKKIGCEHLAHPG